MQTWICSDLRHFETVRLFAVVLLLSRLSIIDPKIETIKQKIKSFTVSTIPPLLDLFSRYLQELSRILYFLLSTYQTRIEMVGSQGVPNKLLISLITR